MLGVRCWVLGEKLIFVTPIYRCFEEHCKMKKLISILTVLFLAQISLVSGQCIADAGQDIIVCSDWNGLDTLQIGGNPSASGGLPPYTYIWETEWKVGSWTYTASDFLNDTTVANPSVINSGENLTFYLTVIDSESNICTDSVHVDFTNFGTHLGYVTYTIQQGDSIYLSGWENVSGGFPPFEYLWRPNHGLADSISLSFWAKPNSSIAYYLTLTDASGCSAMGTPVYFVNVTPVSVDSHESESIKTIVFPNPSKNLITISIEGSNTEIKTIEFFNSKGQLLYKQKTKEKSVQIDTELLTKGLIFYKIISSAEIIGYGKIIVE